MFYIRLRKLNNHSLIGNFYTIKGSISSLRKYSEGLEFFQRSLSAHDLLGVPLGGPRDGTTGSSSTIP